MKVSSEAVRIEEPGQEW